MVNRLGINQNNPFASGDRPVVRNLHLKNTDSLSSRVSNLKNQTNRKQGSFGKIILDAEIVEDESRAPKQSQDRLHKSSPEWQSVAAKMRVQESIEKHQTIKPKQSQQEQIDSLSKEVNSLRSDLNKLMSKNEAPRQAPSSMNSHRHHPRQPSSFDRGIGYEIGNA
ncbi:MAG: hypothetical protein HOA17_09335 [Candidatus Melainabacteria bacterium]|jgi:hypothetical protein|nr:hypothetical protein [Candidatus Melainabacteria bacterium]